MNENEINLMQSKALLLDAFELMNHALWNADDEKNKGLADAEACVSHLEKAGDILFQMTQ